MRNEKTVVQQIETYLIEIGYRFIPYGNGVKSWEKDKAKSFDHRDFYNYRSLDYFQQENKLQLGLELPKHLQELKAKLLNLNGGSTHNQTHYSQMSDGGWEVTRIHDKFILHDVPQYGGEAQYFGIYDLSEIDSLIIKTEQLL